MTIAYADTLITARLEEIATAIDAGAGPGTIKLYDGTQPAKGVGGTNLLATLTFSDPCKDTNTGGILTFATITDETSAPFAGTNTITWFRVEDSDSNFVMDGTVSTVGADLNLTSTSVSQGQTVSIATWTITGGNL